MKPKAVIIGISGPSSSGKTTLARLLQNVFQSHPHSQSQFQKTFIIHEDDFYVPDDKIPYTTLPTGKTLQDWDTLGAIDVSCLSNTLAHVREHGVLPPHLKSIQDLNEESESDVGADVIDDLRTYVAERLAAFNKNKNVRGGDVDGEGQTLAFLEGILLFAPPNEPSHTLSPVHNTIDVHLFLPAAYEDVKARREARSGYVTAGPSQQQQTPLPQRSSSTTIAEEKGEKEVGEGQQQTFWEDPPGYVDDIVWPHYVQDHAWLLVPEGEEWRGLDTQEIVRRAGRGVDVRMDVGVGVAPGRGSGSMVETLRWAVDEVLKAWKANVL